MICNVEMTTRIRVSTSTPHGYTHYNSPHSSSRKVPSSKYQYGVSPTNLHGVLLRRQQKGKKTRAMVTIIGFLFLGSLLLNYKVLQTAREEMQQEYRHPSPPKRRRIETIAVETLHNNTSTTVQQFPTKTLHKESFSACLLTMDDNGLLVEWLAYHYHAVRLRHVIVAIDPRSVTSPKTIFDRWRRQGMTIQEWSDKDFMLNMSTALLRNASYYEKKHVHRQRQRHFLPACLRAMKQQNRTWTLLVDTDEFLRLNLAVISRKLEGISNMPSVETEGSLLDFLQERMARNDTYVSQTCCVQLPRLLFSAKQSQPTKQNQLVPREFSGQDFETLQWRWHTKTNNVMASGMQKTMIDVSQLQLEEIPTLTVQSIHRPIMTRCVGEKLALRNSFFVVNHYLGSWETYSYRNDARSGFEKSYKEWKNRSDISNGFNDDIRPWLQGFVDSQGVKTAKQLLENVGYLEPKNDSSVRATKT